MAETREQLWREEEGADRPLALIDQALRSRAKGIGPEKPSGC